MIQTCPIVNCHIKILLKAIIIKSNKIEEKTVGIVLTKELISVLNQVSDDTGIVLVLNQDSRN